MINKKVINGLFSVIVFTLIFNNMPKNIQIIFIGGLLQNKLIFYPIFIGLVYSIYCQYKYKNIFVSFNRFSKFIIVYLGGICISLIIGLYTYPYYDLILNGPITQIEKLPKVVKILNDFEIYIDEKILTILWIIQGRIKGALLEVLYTFGGAYMIYCWYHNNWQTAFKILIKAVLVTLIVVFGYCFIELFYLSGSEFAKKYFNYNYTIFSYYKVKWNLVASVIVDWTATVYICRTFLLWYIFCFCNAVFMVCFYNCK